MKKYKTKTATYTNRHAFFSALALLFILFGAYVYFVSAAVAHVVVRKELEAKISDMQADLSELEAEYILAKDQVAEEWAYTRGFTKADEKIFVTKKADAFALSRHEDR